MKPTLSELIRPYRSISIIGMCKNAGKTTVLNQIVREVTVVVRVAIQNDCQQDERERVSGTEQRCCLLGIECVCHNVP